MSDAQLWDQGFNDAIEYCNKNYKPFQPMQLPAEFVHRGNAWSKGFGEGLITGKNKIIDAAYPGITGFYIDNEGVVQLFYPKGHPALNKQE